MLSTSHPIRLACLLLVITGCARVEDPVNIKVVPQANGVTELEQFLAASELAGTIPTHQLLRTATDWERCHGPRLEVPPREHWPHLKNVLSLVAELKKRGILGTVEAVSGYRNPELNACAKGAPGSAHTRSFALDLAAEPGQIDFDALCKFWRLEGKDWAMGLSRYPSGRIHLDTAGWRTWGSDHTRATSVCATPRR